MGNKKTRQKQAGATPYKLTIEFQSAKVVTGQSIVGQAVLTLSDSYFSQGGLDKAVLTLIGLERTRICEQKKDAVKKIKNRHLNVTQRQIHKAQFTIHDFQGHKSLNGGRYNLPFSVPVPNEAAASLQVSPVEMSMVDVTYFVEVVITEKNSPVPVKQSKKQNKS